MPQGVVEAAAVERMFAEAASVPDAVIDQLRW